MKYPTLRFVFDRRNIATDKKKASVYLEVAFERKRRDVPTGVYIYKNEWDETYFRLYRTENHMHVLRISISCIRCQFHSLLL